MNASIQAIIDHMFRDTADNAETRALHEELLNNCLEHYDDLIGRGMSETEAIDAVVDSLKGMKEVIDEYPKKAAAQNVRTETKQEQEEIPEIKAEKQPAMDIPPVEKPSEYTFPAAEIRKLRTDLKGCDLKIGKSGDGLIHVRCEDMEQITCDQDGSMLSIKIIDKTRKSMEEASRSIGNQDFSVKGLLSFIGKAIGSVTANIGVCWDVYVDLPETALDEMDLNAKSGDIEISTRMPERLSAHSMSGDIHVEASGDEPAAKVSVSTMSGDASFDGNADTLTMSSMSGEVEADGIFRIAEMKSTSGDVELEGEADQIRMNSVSGDVTIDLKNTTIRSIQAHTTSGDVDINLARGTGSVHAVMSTVSGSARCEIPDGGAGAGLQIQANSVSGDVTIR